MGNCRRGRQRPIPFDCKRAPRHEGECSPYTLAPSGNWLTDGFTPCGEGDPSGEREISDGLPDGDQVPVDESAQFRRGV